MKMVLKILGGIVVLLLLVVGIERVASESGEVVVLQTVDAQGQAQETRLWVVDHNGSAWLRSGSSQSGWYQRLVAVPEVQVTRGDNTFTALAEPQVDQRALINGKMAEKYGWADSYISMLFGREDAIPIVLYLSP